jgi:hypothetical protein
MRRCIGLDVHREFAEVAIWERIFRSAGRIEKTPEALRLFAWQPVRAGRGGAGGGLQTHDRTAARASRRPGGCLASGEDARDRRREDKDRQGRRAGARAAAGGRLSASVWLADDEAQALRRQVARRAHIVRQRTRLKTGCSRSCTATSCRAAWLPIYSGAEGPGVVGCSSRRPGVAAKIPGPLRAFYERLRARRGMQIAVSRDRPQARGALLAPGRRRRDYAYAAFVDREEAAGARVPSRHALTPVQKGERPPIR